MRRVEIRAKGGQSETGKIMQEVSPSVRSRMAAVLAKSNTGHSLVVTAQGLLDADPKVIDNTARSLAMEVPAYTPPQRHALAKFLIEALSAKRIAPKSEAALLRCYRRLQRSEGGGPVPGPASCRLTRPRCGRRRCKQLRRGAEPGTEKRLQALLTCAGERDFSIVAGALMMLKKVAVNAKNSKHWITLLDAPDVATRRFAVEKLQGVENAEVARAMLAQLRHPDRTLREETLKALVGYDAGRSAVLDELLDAAEVDRVWFLAYCGTAANREGEAPAEPGQQARQEPFRPPVPAASSCQTHDGSVPHSSQFSSVPPSFMMPTIGGPRRSCFCCARWTTPGCAISLKRRRRSCVRKRNMPRRSAIIGCSPRTPRVARKRASSWRRPSPRNRPTTFPGATIAITIRR